ncbi:MAG TPA: 6-phosphogluconolactonase [Phycisphaerales bacterium]|nr:6-phosphogluconolactonase [Phycisphaerales bacterium]
MSRQQAHIEILADADAVAHRAVEMFAVCCEDAVRDRGVFRAAVSGGRAGGRFFASLGQSQTGAALPWKRTHLFWADERWAPHDSPHSNYRLAVEGLLGRVPVPPGNVHPIPTSGTTPEAGAAEYERVLRGEFAVGPDRTPQFDLILLGMGAEGHTSSIFPGDVQSLHGEAWVRAVPEAAGFRRITLTGPVLRAGGSIIVMITGAEKATTLARVLNGPADEQQYPIAVVWPVLERVVWLIDRQAASRLDS